MVLTEQELVLAITKSQRDRRIRSALFTRRNTVNFSEQAACDREIQRYLCLKGTIAYRFNCCIVHQPWRFNQVKNVVLIELFISMNDIWFVLARYQH
jgi:hypothetical protein